MYLNKFFQLHVNLLSNMGCALKYVSFLLHYSLVRSLNVQLSLEITLALYKF
jgi:hypothetical protein